MNFTLVMIKPDAVERGLVGNILTRFEQKNYEIFDIATFIMTKDFLNKFYEQHIGKDFYNNMFLTYKNRKAIAVIIGNNENLIKEVRTMIGSTFCEAAKPGTIRFDFGSGKGPNNVIHASDSYESFVRERDIIFPSKRLQEKGIQVQFSSQVKEA